MPKTRRQTRKKMPSADQMQDMELRRNGYTRKTGGTKRTQAKDLNRRKS